MDVRTALVQLRDELNMRQTDFAAALGVSAMTVNRWETVKNPPSRAMALAITAYAASHGVSKVCQTALREALIPSEAKPGIDNVKYAEVTQINNLINDSSNGVFVCDAQTHDLLFVNRQLGRFTNQSVDAARGKKCYEYVFRRGAPCESCSMALENCDSFFSAEHHSNVTGRFYMTRSKIITWAGRKAHIEYITDVSDFKKTSLELERSRELMTIACQAAGIWMFTVDIQTETAHLEPVVQESLGLPAETPDFINKLIDGKIVFPEYAEGLQNVLTRLKNGETDVDFVARTNFPLNRPHWVRLRAKTIEWDENRRPAVAVCSAQEIDREKAIEEKIHYEHEHILESRNDLIAYSLSDLTRNRLSERGGIMGKYVLSEFDGSYDAAIEDAKRLIEPQEDKDAFARLHDRAFLTDCFAKGQLNHSLEYMLRRSDGKLVWVHIEMKLVTDPASGDIMMYEYCFTAHSGKIMAGLLERATENEYEVFGAISLLDGQMTRLIFPRRDKEMEFVPYSENLKSYCDRYIAKEYQAGFLEKASLKTICEMLKKRDTYRITYKASEAGAERRKVAQFTWYDEKRQFCLLSVMDLDRFTESMVEVESTASEALK